MNGDFRAQITKHMHPDQLQETLDRIEGEFYAAGAQRIERSEDARAIYIVGHA